MTATSRTPTSNSAVRIRPAEVGDKAALRAALGDYLRELGAFGPVDETYPWFETYWGDAGRWPYVIESDAARPRALGFGLVNRWSPSGRGTDYAMAEFYIAPEFRRAGTGRAVALRIFARHPGQWEMSVLKENARADVFWRAVIAAAPATARERLELGNLTIYRFVIAAGD